MVTINELMIVTGQMLASAINALLDHVIHDDHVWRWMLACQWQRVGQEEPFVGRTSQVGDETGSRVLAARMARNLMQLWFQYEREYWPYTKWFGLAFARLPNSGALQRHLDAALDAPTFSGREDALVEAYALLARRHNDAALTEPVDPTPRPFHNRPFRVIGAERLVTACLGAVTDEHLRELPLVGSIDQFVDSTDVLSTAQYAARLRPMYDS